MTTEATNPAIPENLTGSDDELRRILDRDEVLVCTRDWSAWGYKTMTDADFEGYADSWDDPESGVAEIRAWRDAAVESFRAALIAHFNSAERQMLGLGPNDGDLVNAWCDIIADFEPNA